jgi:hypothetical protein
MVHILESAQQHCTHSRYWRNTSFLHALKLSSLHITLPLKLQFTLLLHISTKIVFKNHNPEPNICQLPLTIQLLLWFPSFTYWEDCFHLRHIQWHPYPVPNTEVSVFIWLDISALLSQLATIFRILLTSKTLFSFPPPLSSPPYPLSLSALLFSLSFFFLSETGPCFLRFHFQF